MARACTHASAAIRSWQINSTGSALQSFAALGVRQMWASRAQMWASRQRRYGRLVCVYDVKDLTGLGLHARHSLDIIKV